MSWLVHGFSTRPGGASNIPGMPCRNEKCNSVLNLGFTDWDSRNAVLDNRHRWMKALGAEKFALRTLRQMHSDHVKAAVGDKDAPAPRGDSFVSNSPGLLLSVQTADCIPILLADPERRVVAAVHAGWRGTLKRIAAKTAGRMHMAYGVRPHDLLAALGPGIGPCCYEVGPEVVAEFAGQFSEAREWLGENFDLLSSGEEPNPLPWLTMMPPGHELPPRRSHLDLLAANRSILIAAGLRPENIFVAGLCTSCRTDLFFSYRRGRPAGRMMSSIGIR